MIKQIDSSQNSLMQNKFLKVFGTQFKGHKEHLMKHLDNISRKFMNEERNGKKHQAQDFMDIHRYRHAVN